MDNEIRWDWQQTFDERQRKEIEFSKIYAEKFAHGTDGHNGKLIIAKMAQLLTEQESRIIALQEQMLAIGQK